MSLLTGTAFFQRSYPQPGDGIQLFLFPKLFEASATDQMTKGYSEPLIHFLDKYAPQQTPVACKGPAEATGSQQMYAPKLSSLLALKRH